ncbi:MAG: response regulator transcription factor [Burkholderiaceae bacterium]
MTTPRTLFIVDDNAEFRDSAAWWLGGAGYEVRAFDGAPAALLALRQWHAARVADAVDDGGLACLLLDFRMPQMSGLDLHDALTAEGIVLPVIYMTGHGDVPLAVQAMQRGAVTFLEKPFEEAALEAALALAFQRGAELARRAAAQAGAQARPDDASVVAFRQRMGALSPREREVLAGVMAGKINKSIARDLGLSVKTVDLHRANLMDKMQATSLVHLVRMVTSGCVH